MKSIDFQGAGYRRFEPRRYDLTFEQEDRLLRVRQDIMVYWTAEGFSHEPPAQIVSIPCLHVAVVFLAAAGIDNRYRVGQQLKISRYEN